MSFSLSVYLSILMCFMLNVFCHSASLVRTSDADDSCWLRRSEYCSPSVFKSQMELEQRIYRFQCKHLDKHGPPSDCKFISSNQNVLLEIGDKH